MLRDLAFQMFILPPDQLVEQKVIKYEFKSALSPFPINNFRLQYKKLQSCVKELKEQLVDLNRLVNAHSDQFIKSVNKLTHAVNYLDSQKKGLMLDLKTSKTTVFRIERQYSFSSVEEFSAKQQKRVERDAKQNLSENQGQLMDRLKSLQQKMRATKRKYSTMSNM